MPTPSSTELSSFQTETADALASVRESLRAMTRALNTAIDRPADLRKTLNVDSKLSWQVFNVIHEADSMAAASYVPGTPSLLRLIRAARGKGVPSEITDSVSASIEQFDRVVERHAEDRVEFNLMASSVASDATAIAAEREWRRAAFRAERHVWGVSTDAVAGAAIVRLNPDGRTTDECGLLSRRGCRRLRADASLIVAAQGNYGAAGFASGQSRKPLDAAAAEKFGAPILPQFCTQPIPQFRTWQRPDGFTAVEIASNDIGRQTSVDLTIGGVYRNCPLAKSLDGGPFYQTDLRITSPTRLAVFFLLLHRPSFGAVRPEAFNFRQTFGDSDHAIALSAPQFPVRDSLARLGTGRAAWQMPGIDSHDALIQYSMDELGWNPAEFDVFRIHVEHPVLHSVIRIAFDIL